MSGFRTLSAGTPRLAVPSRQSFRTASGSPTRQPRFQQHVFDDFVSQLTPATALASLRNPTGPLKHCLDTATAAEQSFALRAALAASNIHEWLGELQSWPWPEGGGSAGFEEPPASPQDRGEGPVPSPSPSPPSSPSPAPTRTRAAPDSPASRPVTPERQASTPFCERVRGGEHADTAARGPWLGSLPAADVARYEARVAEIGRELDDLQMEDLKRHVLRYHILPLSPPGTPSVDGEKLRAVSVSSAATSFTKMDDLSAVVTAIVLQTLPQLSKLARLLHVWQIRLSFLRRIPLLLASLSAAETAIQSAWHAVRLQNDSSRSTSDPLSPSDAFALRRDEFTVMRAVVEEKVAKAAQITDLMLDSLDGWEDTVPEQWIDRIDAAERHYGEWVSVCERKMREGEWRKLARERPALLPPRPEATSSLPSSPLWPSSAASDGPGDAADRPEEDEAASVLPHTPQQMLSPKTSFGSLGTELCDPRSLGPEPELPQMPIRLYARTDDAEGRSSPSSSSPGVDFHASTRSTVTFSDMPTVAEIPGEESPVGSPRTPNDSSFALESITSGGDSSLLQADDADSPDSTQESPASRRISFSSDDDQLQHQIHEILESIPAKIHLSSRPSTTLNQLNPPDFQVPRKPRSAVDNNTSNNGGNRGNSNDNNASNTNSNYNRNVSNNARSVSSMSTRSMTPSFLLAPAYARNTRARQQRDNSNQEIKLYHLSRSTGEAPIKLFIRLVGENSERVMVRVGGGWADLSEYLKEYASHHSRRSQSGSGGGSEAAIEIRDLPPTVTIAGSSPRTSSRTGSRAGPRAGSRAGQQHVGSSPSSRPGSALDSPVAAAMAPLQVRKTRRVAGGGGGGSGGGGGEEARSRTDGNSNAPRTPLLATSSVADTSPSTTTATTATSRPSSRMSWTEEPGSGGGGGSGATLGMAGPKAKKLQMSEESKAWVESVKERVRIASGERRVSEQKMEEAFGEMGRVGGTKRLFRKGQQQQQQQQQQGKGAER